MWGKTISYGEKFGNRHPDYMNPQPIYWYMPTSWVNYPDQTLYSNAPGETDFKRILTMVYHAILVIGFNDFGPVNLAEFVFFIFALLMGVIMQAIVFSNIVSLYSRLNESEVERGREIDATNGVMMELGISTEVADDIREYFFKTQDGFENMTEFNSFMEMLSPSKKKKIQNHMFS